MIKFKPHQDRAFDAFYSCNVSECELEAEKIYGTETSIVDVCLNHYKELSEKGYR
jgi:hypothetical protein